ncbi:MAG: hydrogenase formation protein HypD [Candidatus Heimdallarchaeota archaeon]|nr:hydrogenase formation protein HypD [Candidatus Heimdallarchaeota archaeon]
MSQSFQDPIVIKKLQIKIKSLVSGLTDEKIKICHVCGTHEYTISHWGLRSLLPKNIEVIAGPGCPVCVCPNKDIEECIWLSKNGYILTTFGDMTRVPSNSGSLNSAKAEGGDVRIVYSFLDAIKLAKKNPKSKIVFFAIGFETTSPMVAIELLNQNIPSNLSILSSFRLVPPAMHLLMKQPDFSLDGFIAPGHVSTITGSGIYEPISTKYNVPIVVAGFEPVDVMLGIVSILEQMKKNIAKTENLYTRVVTREGNKIALKAMSNAFETIDAQWRGIGLVADSGYELAEQFKGSNIRCIEEIPESIGDDIPKGCRCADVILGKIYPEECPLFKRKCTLETPVGPCMVGTEGTCAIHAKFGGYFDLEEE